jgi:uncharacterized protein YoxC
MTETQATILIAFVGLIALSFLLQALALIGLFRRVRDLSARVEAVSAKLTKQIDSLGAQAESFLAVAKSTAEKVHAMQENVTAISKVVHGRVVEVDAFIAEATDTVRLQMARFQDVIETVSQRFDETIDTIQSAIITPIMEVQAIIRGIRTGLDVLFAWRRRFGNRSHQDEEMFI